MAGVEIKTFITNKCIAVFTFSYDLWLIGHKWQSVKALSHSSGHICCDLGGPVAQAGTGREKELLSVHGVRIPGTTSTAQQIMDCCLFSFHMTNLQILNFFYFLGFLFFWRFPSPLKKGSSSADHRCLLSPFWKHHRYAGACAGICTVLRGGMASAGNKWTRLQRYLYFREVYTEESLLNFDSKGKYLALDIKNR